jgi:phage tail-like protein
MKRTKIEALLPSVFRRTVHPGSPLFALLQEMEEQHEPSEEALANLDAFFDPYRAPHRFVPLLAHWVDLEKLLGESADDLATDPFPPGLGRLRELVASAAYLSRWRGTAQGLKLFLETAMGAQGFEIIEVPLDAEGRPRPFHVAIRAPQATEGYRELIEQIIEIEKPAYVTYDLDFAEPPQPE